MTNARARQIVLAARPHGKPQLTDFRLEEPRSRRRLPGSSCSASSTFRSTPICAAGWMTGSPTRSRSSSERS